MQPSGKPPAMRPVIEPDPLIVTGIIIR
jgi:hypothetical protein